MGRRITNKNSKQIKKVTKKTKTRKAAKKTKTRKTKKKISDNVYNKLLKKSRRSLNVNEKKRLEKALHQRYCGCLKSLEKNKKLNKGAPFAICGTSVYLNRGYNIPPNAAKNCKK